MAAFVRTSTSRDATALARIYNHYVLETTVTFDEDALSADEMAQRVMEVESAGLPHLVVESDGDIRGFAYSSPWKGRCAYRYSVESTIYLDPAATGQGLGRLLYGSLMDRLDEAGQHTVLAGIALPNTTSIALHESLGFEKVAHFREVGFKFEKWVDVGYWQRLHS